MKDKIIEVLNQYEVILRDEDIADAILAVVAEGVEERARVAELEKDAARYWWVLGHPQSFEDICESCWLEESEADSITAAIDAAMQQEKN